MLFHNLFFFMYPVLKNIFLKSQKKIYQYQYHVMLYAELRNLFDSFRFFLLIESLFLDSDKFPKENINF